jgi:hypothetical protein
MSTARSIISRGAPVLREVAPGKGPVATVRSDVERRAWSSVYVLAALLVLEPMGDLLSQVLPLQPGELAWRFGFLGFFANNLLTPLLGATLAMVAAAYLGHGRALRVFSVVSLLAAVTLALALGGFTLDALQLRRSVQPAMTSRYDAGALIAVAKYLAGIVGFAVLARTRLRGTSPVQVIRG